MCLNRLRARVPSARRIASGYLSGYTLACRKRSVDGSAKATVIQTGRKSDVVWGVVYDIDNSEKPLLDKVEGLHRGYREEYLQIMCNPGSVRAQIYIAEECHVDEQRVPYTWYLKFMLTGARENELPLDYIEFIESIPSTADPDRKRRSHNAKILLGIT